MLLKPVIPYQLVNTYVCNIRYGGRKVISFPKRGTKDSGSLLSQTFKMLRLAFSRRWKPVRRSWLLFTGKHTFSPSVLWILWRSNRTLHSCSKLFFSFPYLVVARPSLRRKRITGFLMYLTQLHYSFQSYQWIFLLQWKWSSTNRE